MGAPGGDRNGGDVEAVTRALRESRATKFFAMLDGGDVREVKAAKTRGRWERLRDSARALGAHAIECRDDDDAVLAVVQLDELDDVSELEEVALEEPKAKEARGTAGEVERLLSIVLRAQDAAVQRQAEQVTSVTQAALSIMTAAAERAATLERAVLALVQHREKELDAAAAQLDADARAIARARAKPAADDEDDTMTELDKLGTQLVRDAVMPAIMPKIAAAMANAGTKGS